MLKFVVFVAGVLVLFGCAVQTSYNKDFEAHTAKIMSVVNPGTERVRVQALSQVAGNYIGFWCGDVQGASLYCNRQTNAGANFWMDIYENGEVFLWTLVGNRRTPWKGIVRFNPDGTYTLDGTRATFGYFHRIDHVAVFSGGDEHVSYFKLLDPYRGEGFVRIRRANANPLQPVLLRH